MSRPPPFFKNDATCLYITLNTFIFDNLFRFNGLSLSFQLAMRTQDQDIARKLLSLRQEMNALRLQWSCDEHKEMLEEAQCDLEEMHELQDICDTPLDSVQPHQLKQIGVTKMNLNTRRFSIL